MADENQKKDLKANMMVRVDLMDGWMKNIFVDAEPHEVDAAKSLVLPMIEAMRRQGTGGPPAEDGPLLFEEIEKYLQEQAQGANWSPQSELDIRGDFQQLKAILGNRPVTSLDHKALNSLKDVLLRLPANINKRADTRGKTVDEILALGLPAQSAITVRKKWGRFTSFCEWLVGKGLMSSNIAKGKKPRARAQSYEKFTHDDLKKLFEGEFYAAGQYTEAFQFWLPVLGLYTGARLEELAQLHVADVRQDRDTGVWVINITEEVDDEGSDLAKGLKNDSSTRICPLHSAVLKAGFIAYVDDLKQKGYDRLFPELAPDALGKVGPRASEWFTEYRRRCGVGALTGKSRRVYHSLRHSMNATLQRAEIQQEIREALCGHASKATNVRVYGGRFVAATLKEAIQKLDYGITIAPFKPNPKHERARQDKVRRKSDSD